MSREGISCWGYHLVLDMGGCSDAINDVQTVGKFLKELVADLDMHALGAPVVVYVDTPEGKGVSAVQIITTSTITFHGDDKGKAVYLDVFSCKHYEPNVVFALVKKYFAPLTMNHRWLIRYAA
jgi:S-adenosylmethionine/arginine decarboxylase-like enzyme